MNYSPYWVLGPTGLVTDHTDVTSLSTAHRIIEEIIIRVFSDIALSFCWEGSLLTGGGGPIEALTTQSYGSGYQAFWPSVIWYPRGYGATARIWPDGVARVATISDLQPICAPARKVTQGRRNQALERSTVPAGRAQRQSLAEVEQMANTKDSLEVLSPFRLGLSPRLTTN